MNQESVGTCKLSALSSERENGNAANGLCSNVLKNWQKMRDIIPEDIAPLIPQAIAKG
jgi:hypothetical protein